jgi:hypothetical protein
MVAIGRLHIWDKLQLEAGRHFSPGRAVDLGDVVANGAGVRLRRPAGPADPNADRHPLSRP